MALTLAESAKLSQDMFIVGIIEEIVKASPILGGAYAIPGGERAGPALPFIDVEGNALTYNRENAMGNAAFNSVGGTWAESTPTYTQVSTSLTILGGDADVDNFIQQTRSNKQDQMAVVVREKSKAVAHTFEDAFFYGDTAVDANSFVGIHKLVTAGQQIHQGSGTTAAALKLSNLDALCDLVKPKPDLLITTRAMRRGLNAFMRQVTSPISFQRSEFGSFCYYYNEIPLIVSDFLGDIESIASGAYTLKGGGLSSSIFALKFGDRELAGIQNAGITKDVIGNLETKDATRIRIKWYCGLAMFQTLSVAVIDGISASAAVTNT